MNILLGFFPLPTYLEANLNQCVCCTVLNCRPTAADPEPYADMNEKKSELCDFADCLDPVTSGGSPGQAPYMFCESGNECVIRVVGVGVPCCQCSDGTTYVELHCWLTANRSADFFYRVLPSKMAYSSI
jgi:hypothetical protein